MLSFSARHLLTSTAQAPGPRIPASASLPEAKAAGLVEHTPVLTPGDEPSVVEPEGGSCSWGTGTVYPVTILDQASATVGGNLYSFGGVSTAIVANAYKFDGTTWTSIAPLPQPLEFPTAVTDGTVIYILGGAEATAGTPQTTLYKYDPVANTYTTLAPFTVGTWNAAAVYLSGKIYKFAGTGPSTSSTNALEIYNVAGNSWSLGATYPDSISFVSAFTKGGFVYGAGGIFSATSLASAKTYRYDPVGNTWDDASIADLPLTRWGAASSITGYGSNNGWVLAGGYENGVATANIATTVIRWDSVANAWSSLPSMTGGERSRMTGAILGASFYVIGGRSIASSGFAGTNSTQKFLCVSGVAVPTGGTVTISAESCGTPNNSPDPGETLTVALPISNAGDTATTALTATLQATGGVTNPSAAQNYGAVPPGGSSVSRNFTFTVDPNLTCGANVTLTWVINDGATTYPNITKTYSSGASTVNLAQNFDGVTPPALPAGWTNVQTSGTGIAWTTTATGPNSAPNAATAPDPAAVNAAALTSPAVLISSATATLSFQNNYNTESTFDGMVLEYSIDGGTTWTDVITGGGSFVTGGYNATISTSFMSPIAGRMAWSGSSGGYVNSTVNLPASLNGHMTSFRWLMASDSSVAVTGVTIDDIQVLGGRVCQACNATVNKAISDFDGDGKSDVAVVRGGGTWYLNRSTAGFTGVSFGTTGDVAVPGDYDGDGKADEAVVRGGNTWYLLRSTAGFTGVGFGLSGDVPVAGDYDGDGKTDIAVYRPSNNAWYVQRSSDGVVTTSVWGTTGDIAVAGDFDGDGKADLTVFRPSTGTWYTLKSSGGTSAVNWGLSGDVLVPADYDGDHKVDQAVFRSGVWYILKSTGGLTTTSFGLAGDTPVPGDYDGDGKADVGVFRSGTWYLLQSTSGMTTVPFGLAGDVPVESRYIP